MESWVYLWSSRWISTRYETDTTVKTFWSSTRCENTRVRDLETCTSYYAAYCVHNTNAALQHCFVPDRLVSERSERSCFFLLLCVVSVFIPPQSDCLCNVSKHLCNTMRSQACQNCANRPSVHPIEVGQMATLVPTLVNCLWQERLHINSWTRATLTKALQTVVDTVLCTPISELLISAMHHPLFTTMSLAFNYSTVIIDCMLMEMWISVRAPSCCSTCLPSCSLLIADHIRFLH